MNAKVTKAAQMFRTSALRGVLAQKRLSHWHELLEEWCLVHERYCRFIPRESIFWEIERSNLAALAAAAWRAGWVALEEFQQPKFTPNGKINGRADLFLKSCHSEDYVEAKLIWCREGKPKRISRTLEGLEEARGDARALHIPSEHKANRVGVVFVVPSFRCDDQEEFAEKLGPLIEGVQAEVDALAWCFPSVPSPCRWKERVYPGVILLASAL